MKTILTLTVGLFLSAATFADNCDSSGGGVDPIVKLQLDLYRIDKILEQNSYTLRNGIDLDSGRSIREMIEIEREQKVAKLAKLQGLRAEIRRVEDMLSDLSSFRLYANMNDPSSGKSGVELLQEELESALNAFTEAAQSK